MNEEKNNINVDEKNNQKNSEKTINDVLLEWSETSYFKAFSFLTSSVHKNILEKIASIDPVKNPTEICRLQGELVGIYDIIRHIQSVKDEIEQKKEENSDKK